MTTNNIENISGKRLTLYQLIQDYHILIPIIQRDYAQGRPTAHQVRNDFLNALLKYLEENRKHRDLDFIYGTQAVGVKGGSKTFIPLDGQQRLTTLLLLHWYLAVKDDAINELRKHFLYDSHEDSKKSKFTYETRTSSKEFCDALLIADIDLNNLSESDDGKNNSLSKTIKDSTWYYSSWGLDPTIQSMLVMIDAIHNKFKLKSGYYERLTNLQNPVITFQFLDLKEFNLTDDLYIKMNSRGIPLTPFENFKAKFEQYMKESDFNANHSYSLLFNDIPQDVDVKTYFSHKIDTDWANLFWNYTLSDKKEFDKLIMNFFKTIVINDYAGNPIKIDFLGSLIRRFNEDVSFQQYKENFCLKEKLVIDLITILDLLKNSKSKIKTYLQNSVYFDEMNAFNLAVSNSKTAEYIKRIMFHAYCQYLIHWKTIDGFYDIEGLEKWLRVIYNLTENTAPYNQEREFANSIQAINKLLPYSNDILNHLVSLDKLTGFDEVQFNEEKLKAVLILKDNGWDELIYAAEEHGYFNGQIGFIFFLSGVEVYFKENKHCLWSDEAEFNYKKQFIKYKEIAFKIFNNDGLIKFNDYIWERALLATGDYLIEEGSNQSFLVDSDRDISWKRLLKRDKKPEIHCQIIQDVFNKINIDDISGSLNAIKNSYQDDDWRSQFINNYRLFEYFKGKRYIRKDALNHGFVLFTGERMSGEHAELYSYSFYLKHLDKKEHPPFKEQARYYFAAGNEISNRPCAYIDGWYYNGNRYEVDILYSSNTVNVNKYKLKFYYREIEEYNEDLRNALGGIDYKFNIDDNIFVKYVADEDQVLKELDKLCNSLNELSI